ncbi:MAG: nitrous oxide reductase accessory protein NosL [Colwellia sp.]
MNNKKLHSICLYALLTFCITLFSCSDKENETAMIYKAVEIESSDECHLCGMLITRFNGPKGELFRKVQGEKVYKFCSTRDMFSYYLEPENKRNVSQMLVHDMSKMPWEEINNKHFIDAKLAWYVINSSKTGAMGKTLASFSTKADAKVFAKEFGGDVLSFAEIDFKSLF